MKTWRNYVVYVLETLNQKLSSLNPLVYVLLTAEFNGLESWMACSWSSITNNGGVITHCMSRELGPRIQSTALRYSFISLQVDMSDDICRA